MKIPTWMDRTYIWMMGVALSFAKTRIIIVTVEMIYFSNIHKHHIFIFSIFFLKHPFATDDDHDGHFTEKYKR